MFYFSLVFHLDITIDHLQLHEGITYYVSITACNYADLCATATSDGVLVDTSPPVPGKVIDGVGNTDIRYQASRYKFAKSDIMATFAKDVALEKDSFKNIFDKGIEYLFYFINACRSKLTVI